MPATFSEAKEALRTAPLDNQTCKSVLTFLKVTRAHNAKFHTKLKLIAIKMTQRQFFVNSILECIDVFDGEGGSWSDFFNNLRSIAVKITRTKDGPEKITWLRRDILIWESDEVQTGQPV